VHLLIMAKEPVPGRVKTRLCPPCTPEQAAAVAEAALADTLAVAHRCGADRVVVALDGRPGRWLPPGTEVIAQRGNGLAERLGHAWSQVGGPGFQIGMDTPQLSVPDLDLALTAVADGGPGGAVLGPAADGGWWGLGVQRPVPGMFDGVPMSTEVTGAAQRNRLEALGLQVTELAEHRDLDTVQDLAAVAGAMPDGHLPSLVRRLDLRVSLGA
jgi:rSAM/selenodomain-associated transferase 1